jgi:hypothetical protein
MEQQGRRVGDFLVPPPRPPVPPPSGPPLGPPPGPLVPSPPAPPSQGRSCQALPRRCTGRQSRPWLCRIRQHRPLGRPRYGRVGPRCLCRRVRSVHKMPPPLFQSSPLSMLQMPGEPLPVAADPGASTPPTLCTARRPVPRRPGGPLISIATQSTCATRWTTARRCNRFTVAINNRGDD